MNASISILGVVVFRVAEIGEPLEVGQHLGQGTELRRGQQRCRRPRCRPARGV